MLLISRRKRRRSHISKHKIYIQTEKAAWMLSLTWQDHTDTHPNCISPKTHTHVCNEPPKAAVNVLPLFSSRKCNSSSGKGDRWDALLKASLLDYLKDLMSASGGTVRKMATAVIRFNKTRQIMNKKWLQRRYRWVRTRKNAKHNPVSKNTDREGGRRRSQLPGKEVE